MALSVTLFPLSPTQRRMGPTLEALWNLCKGEGIPETDHRKDRLSTSPKTPSARSPLHTHASSGSRKEGRVRAASGRSSGAPQGCSRRASGCRPENAQHKQRNKGLRLSGDKDLGSSEPSSRTGEIFNVHNSRSRDTPLLLYLYCKHCLDSISSIG